MFTRAEQQKEFQTIWDSMKDHLDLFVHTGNEEALHQLRVDIKKINALLDFFTGKKLKDKRKPLRVVFRQAGLIRTAAIHLGLLNRFQVQDISLAGEQQAIMAKETRKFMASAKTYERSLKKSKKKLGGQFKDLEDGEIILKCQDSMDELYRLFREYSGLEADLHETRKKAKVLMYAYAVLGEDLQDKIPIDMKYLHHLQDLVGKWHDISVTLTFLEEKKYGHIATLDRLTAKEEKLLKNILSEAKGFENKIKKASPVSPVKKRKGTA